MNNKGQALVEFILILPIFIFLIFVIFDFGMIFNEKNRIESISTDIVNLYRNGTDIMSISDLYNDFEVSLDNEGEYDHFIIKSNVKIYTPGLNLILGNPYQVTVERYIYHE